MEITIGEVLLLSNVTEALLYIHENGQRLDRKMPFKIKHKLIKATDKFRADLGPYEKERIELVKKFGEPIEEGKEPMKVKEESLQDFYKELGEVLATKTEINLKYCMLTEDDVDKIEGGDIDLQEEAIRTFQKHMIINEEGIPEIVVA